MPFEIAPRRSQLELKVDVLKALVKSPLFTRCLHTANINSATVLPILNELQDSGCIIQEMSLSMNRMRRVFFLTEKGYRALQLYNAFLDALTDYEETIPKVNQL